MTTKAKIEALRFRPTELAAFAPVEGAGSRRFKKEVLPVGHFVHPVTRQAFDFDRDFLERLAKATNRWVELGHKVWFPVGADCHFDDANDARQNLGFWSAFRVEGEKLVADVEVLDAAAAEKIGRTIQDVSAAIQWGALSSSGENFEAVIVHVAATPCPVIPNQDNFVPLAREVTVNGDEERDDEKTRIEEARKDDESTELAEPPKTSAEEVVAKAREMLGLPEDADGPALLKALSEALADDEDEVAEGVIPAVALSQRVKELEDRLADQEREAAEREIYLAREASVRAGVPLGRDVVEDARTLFLAGKKDIARRVLKLGSSSAATTPATAPRSPVIASQPNPGTREEDEKAVERDRVLEKAYLSQGLRVEKNAAGRITNVTRPARAKE